MSFTLQISSSYSWELILHFSVKRECQKDLELLVNKVWVIVKWSKINNRISTGSLLRKNQTVDLFYVLLVSIDSNFAGSHCRWHSVLKRCHLWPNYVSIICFVSRCQYNLICRHLLGVRIKSSFTNMHLKSNLLLKVSEGIIN